MMKNEPMATGKKAKTPEKYEPIELLAAVTTITQNHHAGTPGKIGARHLDTFDRAGNAIAARGQNGERVDHRVQYDGAGGAPIHEPQQKHGDKPDQKCAAKAEPQRVLLRQRGIAEREQRAGGIGELPTALCAMNCGVCSSARMIMAAPPAVGSAAISDPMKGPLRSTTTEATTTIEAVIAILSASPYHKDGSASVAVMGWPGADARNRSADCRSPKQATPKPGQAPSRAVRR